MSGIQNGGRVKQRWTTCKLPIAAEGLAKLYSSEAFNQAMPRGLQNKVWFEIMLYFGRRGREKLHELKKGLFAIAVMLLVADMFTKSKIN